ncbi:unnamed protein product [Arctia plantaginis]|uniref:Uncharacterized protein n=1 Tax=Arctia plantaginis TaxID=874455 RepID=A0A8S1A0J1_ARCPL|nr:unnamed protein product [Arctia plantaginis]CAB3238068.1 unnamed protein product [Arctia plantaginis]
MYRITFFISMLVLVLSTSLELNKEEGAQDTFSGPNITAPFTIMREISKGSKLEEFKEYADDIQKRGSVLLKDLSKLIIKVYGFKEDDKLNIKSSIENFKKNIKSSRDFVARLDQEFGIDDVYMFKDLLETSCKLIFVEQKRFLQNVEARKNSQDLYGNIVLELHQTIFKRTVSLKRDELLYLCKNYGICVPYSPFTHNFEYFIDEILLLPDTEIGMIINLLSELVRNNNNFLKLIKSDPKTVLLVKMLFTNTYNMKQSIMVLQNLIKKRHILYFAPDYKQQIRIQSARAILDTMDKAFYFDHGDKLSFDIYATIKAIRDWGTAMENFALNNDKTDVHLYKMAIRKFINIIFKAINFKKNDINGYLVKTIVTGTLENGTGYENLFKNGFKGVYTLL